MTNDLKSCSYCAERIKAEAIKCRFCGSDLTLDGAPKKRQESKKRAPNFAGFWRRFAALCVDALIFYVLFELFLIFYFFAYSGTVLSIFLSPTYWVISILIGVIYYVSMISFYGATLGKMFIGVKVVLEDGKGGISLGRALARYLSQILSFVILGIGYLVQLFTEKRQALHDKMAGTIVIDEKQKPSWLLWVVILFYLFFVTIINALNSNILFKTGSLADDYSLDNQTYSAPAPAPAGDYSKTTHGYSAIYFDESSNVFGWAAGYGTESEAGKAAEDICYKRGAIGSCKKMLSGSFSCVAIAQGTGWNQAALDYTYESAKKRALEECNMHAMDCAIPAEGIYCAGS